MLALPWREDMECMICRRAPSFGLADIAPMLLCALYHVREVLSLEPELAELLAHVRADSGIADWTV